MAVCDYRQTCVDVVCLVHVFLLFLAFFLISSELAYLFKLKRLICTGLILCLSDYEPLLLFTGPIISLIKLKTSPFVLQVGTQPGFVCEEIFALG
jgi:hypothetical protein